MSDERTSRGSLTSILSIVGAFVLGAILVVATIGKLGDPIVFVELIHNEGLDFWFTANTVALLALAIETFLGVALLLGVRNIWILAPSTALVIFFISLTGWNYYLVLSGQRDASYDCGCFGVFLHRNAVAAFWQDLPMLGVPLVLALLDRRAFRRPFAQWKISVALAGTVAVLAYTVYGVGLPTQPLPGPGAPAGNGVLTFQPNDQFELLVEGEPDAGGRILECAETLQLMLISDSLAKPLLIDIRSSRVMELKEQAVLDGSGKATLRREPDLQPAGNFSVGSEGLRFDYDGREFALRNRS